jgi:hypothetical protein
VDAAETTTEHIKEIKESCGSAMNWYLFTGALISLFGMLFHGVAGQKNIYGQHL